MEHLHLQKNYGAKNIEDLKKLFVSLEKKNKNDQIGTFALQKKLCSFWHVYIPKNWAIFCHFGPLTFRKKLKASINRIKCLQKSIHAYFGKLTFQKKYIWNWKFAFFVPFFGTLTVQKKSWYFLMWHIWWAKLN